MSSSIGCNHGHGIAGPDSFPPEVASRLKTYVYRLIDPRNGETFYVGKGRGDRVFAHIRAEKDLEDDELGNKLRRIRDVRLAGMEVAHVIHRHGMDDETAFEVEAALIDAYPGLANVAGGRGATEFGAMRGPRDHHALLGPACRPRTQSDCSSA